jgi:arylsulfatase A-like enzyme
MPIAGHHPSRAPGAGPRPFDERSDRDAHANDLHVADDALGALRAGLTARGLDRRVVYVVAGDHGEAFGEHPGNVAHALYLYEENLRVPLFVAAPGALTGPPRRVPGLASLIDLAPLALAGLRVPLAYEGRSLLGPQLPPRPVRFATEQGARRAGLRDGRWKLIVDEDTGRAQLFDLDADPGEGQDLSTRVPDRVARMRACLGS